METDNLNVEVTKELLEQLALIFKNREANMRMRMRAFLDHTLYLYQITPRAVLPHGSCQYSPTIKSPGCAIGMFMHIDHCLEADELQLSAKTLARNYKEFLPDWMQDFGGRFLRQIQGFHDESKNWLKVDLPEWRHNLVTIDGQLKYNTIILKINRGDFDGHV